MSERVFQFEIVVVGGGPAGIAAACAATESGKRVALVDDTPWLGGQIWRGQREHPSIPQAQAWLGKFRQSGAELLDRTSVIAAPGSGVLLAEHPDGPREIHFSQLVLATGARELFLPFPGWTLPGVTGVGGLQSLAKHGWPVKGQRIVVAGTGPLLLAAAHSLKKQGATIVSIAEQAPFSRVAAFGSSLVAHPAKLFQAARIKAGLFGVPYRCGVWPTQAIGDSQLRGVTLTNGQRTRNEDCDLLACAFGFVPNVELPLAIGCKLRDGFVQVDESQMSTIVGVFCAGEPTGIGGADCALIEGQIAGYAATRQRGGKFNDLMVQRDSWHRFRTALADAFALRPQLKTLATDDTILCRCEDVTLGRMKQYVGWRVAKLQSRCGMGSCQGRVCGAAAKVVLGWGMESVRPPVLPARVESLLSSGKPAVASPAVSAKS